LQINSQLLSYLEDLSCLALSDGERTGLTGDLQKILDYMARLGEIDTNGIPERSHPFDNVNAFRDDQAHDSFERELILKNAPARNSEFIIAPKTVV